MKGEPALTAPERSWDLLIGNLADDAWSAAHGSLRGSTLLKSGAVLAALSVLLEAGGNLIDSPSAWNMSMVAWTGWALALVALGLGFVWVGLNPVMSRVGLAVGAVHLLHALLLLARIFGQVPFPFSPKALVVGRLLLVILFAVMESRELGPRTSRFLIAAAALVLVKAALPLVGLDPDLGGVGAFLRDSVPAVLLALAIFHAGETIRSLEDDWARHQVSGSGSGFADYNNPFNESQQDDDAS